MKKNLLSVLVVLMIVSTACNFSTSLTPSNKTTGGAPLPSNAQTDGFSAEATAGGSVSLKWDPISGADHYLLEVQIGDEFLPLATLPADQTSYKDVNVPPATQFTYRLSSLVNAKPGDSKVLTIETPPETGNPLKVSVEFDQSAASIDPNNFDPNSIDPNNFDPSAFMPQPVQADAVIGPQGGEVSVTGSSGVVYTLSVPPNALRFEVPITLKSISGIPDLPLSGGLMAAVFIEPDMLVFDVPATLTATLPADSPAAAGPLVLAFSFASDGQEFHLHPFSAGGGQSRLGGRQLASLQPIPPQAGPLSFVLDLVYGGGYGQGSGTVDDVNKIILRPASHSQDRMAQQLALNQLDDLTPIASDKAMASNKLGDAILQKADQADSWRKFTEVMDDFSAYVNAGAAKYEFNQILIEKIFDRLVDRAQTLLKKNQGDCLTYDDFSAQELVERLSNPKDAFSTALAARFTKKYGQKLLDDLAFGVKTCSFDLSMKSRLTFEAEGSTLIATASAPEMKLFLVYNKGDIFLFGGGEMTLDLQVKGQCSFPIKQYKKLIFTVEKLSLVYVDGKFSNFGLNRYAVHGWADAAGVSASGLDCPTMVTLSGGGDYWTGLFTIARFTLSNMAMTDWAVSNNLATGTSLKATWTSVVPNFSPLGGRQGKMSEDTKFVLTVTKNSK